MHPYKLHEQNEDAYQKRHHEQAQKLLEQIYVNFLNHPFKLSDTKLSGNRSVALWKT